MNIKSFINVMKVVSLAVTVVPPVVEGASIITKSATRFVKNKIDSSENIQEIKKRYKLRSEQGIITVDNYTEC